MLSAYESSSLIKIAVIGQKNAGKSSLVQSCLGASFDASPQPTLGVDYRLHTAVIDGKPTSLHLWDTAGVGPCMMANGILLVYDASDLGAFKDIERWLEAVQRHSPATKTVVLCGSKVDLLCEDDRIRSLARMNSVAAKAGVSHIQTSAKLGRGVHSAFELVAREVQEAEATATAGHTWEGHKYSSGGVGALKNFFWPCATTRLNDCGSCLAPA